MLAQLKSRAGLVWAGLIAAVLFVVWCLCKFASEKAAASVALASTAATTAAKINVVNSDIAAELTKTNVDQKKIDSLSATLDLHHQDLAATYKSAGLTSDEISARFRALGSTNSQS